MKKEGSKKTKVNETKKNVSIVVEKIKDSEKDHKEIKDALEQIKIEHANEIQINDDRKCVLVLISTPNLVGYKKVHATLTKKLEEQLSNPVVIIPAKKRVNGKEYRTYVSKKVPRDRTLTAVFDGYLVATKYLVVSIPHSLLKTF